MTERLHFHFHALEEEMATHSSILAWKITGTGKAWWAAVYGVAQIRTRLKRLSSSSSKHTFTRWYAFLVGLLVCFGSDSFLNSCSD